MEESEAVKRLIEEVADYARGCARDVARGAETPRLAALLAQKFGYGVARAAMVIYGAPAGHAVMREVDERTARIDPDWHQHAQQRWAARPADIRDGRT